MRNVILVIVTIILSVSLFLTGCSNLLPDNRQETNNAFNYDLLLQMPREYVGETDRAVYSSLEEFKNQTFSMEIVQGAVATIECLDVSFYITIRHDDEDIMISGKTVSKCKVVTIGETFNNYSVKDNTIVELVQDYYVIPTNEEDEVDMYESFGADFIKDSTGAPIGMEIKDGNYALQIKEGVDYTLKIRSGGDVLPMEPGMKYTGVIVSHDSINSIQYLSPIENTHRYDVFQMSESDMKIAAEIKQILKNKSAN